MEWLCFSEATTRTFIHKSLWCVETQLMQHRHQESDHICPGTNSWNSLINRFYSKMNLKIQKLPGHPGSSSCPGGGATIIGPTAFYRCSHRTLPQGKPSYHKERKNPEHRKRNSNWVMELHERRNHKTQLDVDSRTLPENTETSSRT